MLPFLNFYSYRGRINITFLTYLPFSWLNIFMHAKAGGHVLTVYLSLIDDSDSRNEFERIYTNYRKQMFFLAKSIVKNDSDAEDVVHDVFLTIASKNMPTIRKITNKDDLRNYLLKATKNTCLNHLKKHKKESVPLDTFDECNLGNEQSISDEEFLDLIFTRIEADRIVDAISTLPDIYRDALYYHFVVELSVREIAKLINQNTNTVKKQLVRGKRKLLDALGVVGGVKTR